MTAEQFDQLIGILLGIKTLAWAILIVVSLSGGMTYSTIRARRPDRHLGPSPLTGPLQTCFYIEADGTTCGHVTKKGIVCERHRRERRHHGN